jgi:hypothetical protein
MEVLAAHEPTNVEEAGQLTLFAATPFLIERRRAERRCHCRRRISVNWVGATDLDKRIAERRHNVRRTESEPATGNA